MGKVLGLGGVFFKSKDPKALMAWYQRCLGIPDESADYAAFKPETMPKNGCSVWTPFSADTGYFAPSNQTFMFNLVVDNLGEVLAQVVEGGASLVGDVESYDYGRFGWFLDPEGNKVELWEPA